MYTFEEIVQITTERRSNDSKVIRRMADTRDRYHNDISIPMPDMDGEPEMRALMPQLVRDGIEGAALRAAGPFPTIDFPAIDVSKATEVKRANTRRRATYATWHANSMSLQLRRAYRQLAGYGTFAMVVLPDTGKQAPRIELRDPLTAYPDPRAAELIDPPRNIGFIYGRSPEWIVKNYPEAYQHLEHFEKRKRVRSVQLWDMIEWVDEEEIVIGIIGPRDVSVYQTAYDPFSVQNTGMELRRWPNRLGIVPVACPRRVTLDRIAGQLEHVVPMVDWMARLTALEVLAAERAVFPDTVIIGDDVRPPELVTSNGEWQDGRTGEVNLITNAKAIQQLQAQPGPATDQILQALERAGRMSGGVSPLYGGNNPSSLRTGRAISTIGDFSVDPNIAELQDIMARALAVTVNPAILETYRAYWPRKKYTMFSGWPGDHSTVNFTPAEDFGITYNTVNYAFPGTDVSQITVAIGQALGAGVMSRKTARTKHPFIDDAEAEEQRIDAERLLDALAVSIQQQGAGGQLPVPDLAAIIKYRQQGETMPDAVLKAQEDAQKRQAAEAPPPEPGQATAPEEQPGLAAPGMGVESSPNPLNAVQQPVQSLQNFRQVLNALRS